MSSKNTTVTRKGAATATAATGAPAPQQTQTQKQQKKRQPEPEPEQEEEYEDEVDLEQEECEEDEDGLEMFTAQPEEILDMTLGNYFSYRQETEDGEESSLNIADILILIKQSIDQNTAALQALLSSQLNHTHP